MKKRQAAKGRATISGPVSAPANDEFVPILAGMGLAKQKHRSAMEEWLRSHKVTIDDIGAQNIRCDIGRADPEGRQDFWRWSIKRSVLARLGLPALPLTPR